MDIEQHLENRLFGLRSALAENDLDGAVVSRDIHIYYFTGIDVARVLAFLIVSEHACCLVLPDTHPAGSLQKQTITFRADPMYGLTDAANEASQALKAALVTTGLSGKSIGVEAQDLPLTYAKSILSAGEIMDDIGPLIEGLRIQKDEYEVACLLANQRINDHAFATAAETIRPGLDELTLYETLYAVMVKEVGHPFLWRGCLGGGTRSALPNPQPSNYKLKQGDLLLIDIFSKLNHYFSDSTRTFVVGHPDSKQLKLHQVLQDALWAGEKLLKPGERACDIDAAVRDVVKNAPYSGQFSHHVGHGLGLCQIESPLIVPTNTTVLQSGCVIALEPGIYFPGSGGMRLENVYHITNTGYECLTGTRAVLLAAESNH